MKLVTVTLLLVSLILLSSSSPSMAGFSGPAPTPAPASPLSFCDSKCAVRCQKAGRAGRCLKYCRMCCRKCHCVPSGTYGNKSECPCYRDMKSPKGKPKCP